MSPPASERAEPIVPDVGVAPTLRPSYGARTAQRAVPTISLNRYCRAATTPPRAAAERLGGTARFAGNLCAAARGATRRSATSSTRLDRYTATLDAGVVNEHCVP